MPIEGSVNEGTLINKCLRDKRSFNCLIFVSPTYLFFKNKILVYKHISSSILPIIVFLVARCFQIRYSLVSVAVSCQLISLTDAIDILIPAAPSSPETVLLIVSHIQGGAVTSTSTALIVPWRREERCHSWHFCGNGCPFPHVVHF